MMVSLIGGLCVLAVVTLPIVVPMVMERKRRNNSREWARENVGMLGN